MSREIKTIRLGKTFPNKDFKKLYNELDRWLKRVNPCKVCNGKCLRGQLGGRNFCCDGTYSNGKGACKHCGKNGCTADRPLTCRLWLCHEAENALTPKQREELKEFHKAAGPFASYVYYFRATRQDAKRIYNSSEYYRTYI